MRDEAGPSGHASSASSQALELDGSIKSALRRLPALADRLLSKAPGEPWSSPRSTEADYRQLAELLARLHLYLQQFVAGSADGAAAAAAVLAEAAVRTALLRLVAAAALLPLETPRSNLAGSSGSSGGSSGRQRTAQEACGVTEQLLLKLGMQLHTSAAASDFVQGLLRMQLPQRLARRFASAAASPAALTPHQVELAAHLTRLLNGLLVALVPGSEAARALLASMRCELAEALRDSNVLEHAALLSLPLLLRADGAVAASGAAAGSLSLSVLLVFASAQSGHLARWDGDVATGSAALLEVLSGPCVRHLVLVHGVAALCAADGGSAHGLPAEVQQAAYNFLAAGCLATLSSTITTTTMMVLSCDVSPPPRVGTRAAVLLLLRLARLAVTSGDVWTALQAGLPLLPQPALGGRASVVIGRENVVVVAHEALGIALRLLRGRLVADPPAWAVEAGVECWRLVAASTRRNMLRWSECEEQEVICLEDVDRLRWLGERLLHEWVPLLPPGQPLPPAPPPGLAAALAGGLLPCLERLLRRADEEPHGPESAVVSALLRRHHTWPLWAHLLEYGEPRQAAALLATVAKLLRRRAAPPAPGAPSGDDRLAIALCTSVLVSALAASADLSQAEGRQRARLLTYAACQWLPALSELALQALADPRAPGTSHMRVLLTPLLSWLPLLASRCKAAGEAAAAAAGPADEAAAADAAGSAAAEAAGGWRLLLLEEVRVVPLLGGALRLAQHPHARLHPDMRAALAESCCAVAAAWPDEVLRAAGVSAAWWPPRLLRALLPQLRESGRAAQADATEALAAWLEGRTAGGSGGCGSSGGAEGGARARLLAAVAAVQDGAGWRGVPLVPLAEARAVLRTCSYPSCVRLDGDSEAEAVLRWCRFCGLSCYCCGQCQLSHWQEGGHKQACPGGRNPRSG
ncbi:hypothetical protein TSOC_009227 [Tetrabaena socialis]|uniref:phytol kinase n=1 Tax=Tetrabaena socialis TaxID=47790 RepID=A0A2J7ZWF8_9CHLO|nr:hypothetical protein TSOC_009227 [Tetrabaena socialis]|eukprot:PNH04588.1 hypothetical protein TSOC_009227 [Tetrabaena socialis]